MTIQENWERYLRAAHAVQSGIKFLMNFDPSLTDLKHLRVGIDTGKVEHGALAKLLTSKGLITDEEYVEAVASAMEEEKQRVEEVIERQTGKGITLA